MELIHDKKTIRWSVDKVAARPEGLSRMFMIFDITKQPRTIGLGVLTDPLIQPIYNVADIILHQDEELNIPDNLSEGVYMGVIVVGPLAMGDQFPPGVHVTETEFVVFEVENEVELDETTALKAAIMDSIETVFVNMGKFNNRKTV
jgi:hypothetical protein